MTCTGLTLLPRSAHPNARTVANSAAPTSASTIPRPLQQLRYPGNKGSGAVERLLEARHRERVPADINTVAALIAAAGRHVASATAADDPEGALALAYDTAGCQNASDSGCTLPITAGRVWWVRTTV
jgi:hypothetical protein